MLRTRCLLVGLALSLSGCLLPQPDTPVIPPYAGSQTVAVPAKAPAKDTGAAQPVPAAAPAAGTADQGTISNHAGGLISNNAGGLVSNDAGKAAIAPVAPNGASSTTVANKATVSVQVSGMTLKTLVAVADDGASPSQGADVAADGTFRLMLAPGNYHLELTLADGKTMRVDKALTFGAGEVRSLSVKLQADPPTATITEEAPLETLAPSPTPAKTP